MARRPILSDHQKRGKILIPPFTHMLGPMREVSWMRTIMPELVWIALLQFLYGHARGVELITALARSARTVSPSAPVENVFAGATSYSRLSEPEWGRVREALTAGGQLAAIQESLSPLVSLYPECPMRRLFDTTPPAARDALTRIKGIVSVLYDRGERDPMMVQATAVWLEFDSGLLKVAEGLALAKFAEIERYPETDLSRQVGSSVRASLNFSFGQPGPDRAWPRYFWNRGMQLDECELCDD